MGSIEKGEFIPYEAKNAAAFPGSDTNSGHKQEKSKSIIHQFFRSDKEETNSDDKQNNTK